jgi:glycosyltransferase involved in cell wall biosynthesis
LVLAVLSNQNSHPLTLMLARWVGRAATAALRSLKQMYTGVVIPPDGFVPDLSEAFDRAKVLLAPNFVYGSGISTKIMQGLEHGVPVVVNTHGGNGYDCDDETEGRLRCAHMQLCGAPTRQGRNAGNHTIDGYWYARSAMGLMKNKARWQELVENGRRYVAHTRSLSSWDVVLEPLFANRTRASGRISSS